MTTPTIALRQPSTLSSQASTSTSLTVSAPPLSWLTTTWNITHSTLPMWRKARNVQITYTALPSSNNGTSVETKTKIDDLVTYQSFSSDKLKTVKGIDTPLPSPDAGASSSAMPEGDSKGEERASLVYKWRGKAFLLIATSQWEILGWGDEPSLPPSAPSASTTNTPNSYMITYFAKTIFTPAGVDVYSRPGRLREETLEGIRVALRTVGGEVGALAEGLFEVSMNEERGKGV